MTGPMQRSLIIVRHGRTVANASGLLLGRADPELDDSGVEQAAAVGRAIESGRFGQIAAVVSSPLLRTRSTAKALGLPVQIDEDPAVVGEHLGRRPAVAAVGPEEHRGVRAQHLDL